MPSNDLFITIDEILLNLKKKRLADVFRMISFTPFEKYGEHQHVRIEINYVKKGSCVLNLLDESFTFAENEMMIINSNVLHSFEAGPKGTILMQLEFLPEVFSSFDSEQHHYSIPLNPLIVFSESNRLIKIVNNVRIMRTVQRIVNELTTKNKYFDYLVIMYYAELLVLIFRHLDEAYTSTGTNEKLKIAISYMRMNYQSETSIESVASHCGISERYLRKLFINELQMSPIDYLNKIRIDKAYMLLKNTEFSVKEVCFMCGFKTPQYFSRVFKAQIGTAPKSTVNT